VTVGTSGAATGLGATGQEESLGGPIASKCRCIGRASIDATVEVNISMEAE